MKVLIEIVVCITIADLLSGFFHWLEDCYGSEHWPITGSLITKPNILHHHNPRHFIHASWFLRNRVLLIMGSIALVTGYFFNFLNWKTILIIMIGINANEIHRWAHRTNEENGKIVTFCQRLKIIQSPSHHALHHQYQKNTHYCVITNFLNPVLDGLGIWSFLEWTIAKISGIQRRSDLSANISIKQR